MMLRLKNFFITFVIALAVFAVLAYSGIHLASAAILTPDGEKSDSGDSSNDNNLPGNSDNDEPAPGLIDGQTFSFILIGTDEGPGGQADVGSLDRQYGVRAGAIIYVRLIRETNTALIIPIPPTTIINARGVNMPIYRAYETLGNDAPQFMAYAVSWLTGLPVDFWAVANFSGMAAIIDRLGGVMFDVPYNMVYSNEESGININIRQGSQRLSGRAAVDMLRFPNHPSVESQLNLMVSFFQRLYRDTATVSNFDNATGLFSDLVRHTRTNFTLADLVSNLPLIFHYNQMTEVVLHLPGTYNEDGIFTHNQLQSHRLFASYR